MRGLFARCDEGSPDMAGADEAFEAIRAANFIAQHERRHRETPDMLGPNVRANLEQAMAMSLGDAARAHADQTRIYRDAQRFFRDVDVLVCPAAAVPPFPHRQLFVDEIDGTRLRTYFHWLGLAYGLTLIGHPVCVIPCGRDSLGLPFGIQICGPRRGDRFTLGVAAALERALAADTRTARPLPVVRGASSPAVPAAP